MAAMQPARSDEIARRAGLAERYVREWLAVMVMAGLVAYTPQRRTYALPPEHAACLCRHGSSGNLAVYAQNVTMMAQVQDAVMDCFGSGAGLPYDAYPRFHEIMEEDSGQTVTARLFETVLPLAPGLDRRLRDGLDVLDVGCGRGSTLMAMASRYVRSRFIGYDFCADAIEAATRRARGLGLANVTFAARDLGSFHAPARFDLITAFDAVHDQKDPQALLCALRAALRPGGMLLMQDIGGSAHLENNHDFPMAAFLYAVSCTHCTPVSLAQGGEGLGTMWGWETAERMLRAAGFDTITRHVLPHDPMNVWFVATVPDRD